MNTPNLVEPIKYGRGLPLTDSHNGCERVTDGETLKMRLRTGLGLPDDQFLKTALEILHDEKEPLNHKVFAVQNLARVKAALAEESLTRIVEGKDTRLSFAALNTLALIGTEKTYEALSGIRSLPFKSLERQKDFTQLIIGYRHQLPGAEKILSRLLEDTGSTNRVEEFPLRFQKMEADEIGAVLKQSREAEYGITLSRNMALSLKAGGQTFYFCFTNKFDDPSEWQKVLQTNQVVGQLLMKEAHSKYINRQYIALATPMRDHVQLSIFKRDGELFMLAQVNYDREKNSFSVSNAAQDQSANTGRIDFKADTRTSVTMNLAYIRHHQKKKTAVLEAPEVREDTKA